MQKHSLPLSSSRSFDAYSGEAKAHILCVWLVKPPRAIQYFVPKRTFCRAIQNNGSNTTPKKQSMANPTSHVGKSQEISHHPAGTESAPCQYIHNNKSS